MVERIIPPLKRSLWFGGLLGAVMVGYSGSILAVNNLINLVLGNTAPKSAYVELGGILAYTTFVVIGYGVLLAIVAQLVAAGYDRYRARQAEVAG